MWQCYLIEPTVANIGKLYIISAQNWRKVRKCPRLALKLSSSKAEQGGHARHPRDPNISEAQDSPRVPPSKGQETWDGDSDVSDSSLHAAGATPTLPPGFLTCRKL